MTGATVFPQSVAERVVERRGVRLRVYEGGSGPPLLLVHGFGGGAWNWGELAHLLAPRRRLIVPDLPGHGGSSPLPAVANLAAYADAVAPLCDGPVDVAGHSMGGVVALRLAARRPELVRRLVLVSAAGISSATRRAEAFLAFAALIQPARRLGRFHERIGRSEAWRRFAFTSFTVSDPLSLSPRAVDGFLLPPREHSDVRAAVRALARDDPRHDLHRVRCPVLCVWGARDNQVPIDDAFEYARRLRAPLRIVADAGHLVIGERPHACADAIDRFLP